MLLLVGYGLAPGTAVYLFTILGCAIGVVRSIVRLGKGAAAAARTRYRFQRRQLRTISSRHRPLPPLLLHPGTIAIVAAVTKVNAAVAQMSGGSTAVSALPGQIPPVLQGILAADLWIGRTRHAQSLLCLRRVPVVLVVGALDRPSKIGLFAVAAHVKGVVSPRVLQHCFPCGGFIAAAFPFLGDVQDDLFDDEQVYFLTQDVRRSCQILQLGMLADNGTLCALCAGK